MSGPCIILLDRVFGIDSLRRFPTLGDFSFQDFAVSNTKEVVCRSNTRSIVLLPLLIHM